MKNIAFESWQIWYTIVLKEESNTQLIPLRMNFPRAVQDKKNLSNLGRLSFYSLQFNNQTLEFYRILDAVLVC